LLGSDGAPLGEHFKHKLVPFGEYIPFSNVFPVLKRVFQNANPNLNTQPGREFQIWTLKDVRMAAQVCFEILYPNLARRFVREGARLIINSANDGWYQDIGQTEQHLALGIYRCIETRVPMVRATNTGVSAYVSAAGEIQGETSPFEQPWVDCRSVPVPELSSFYRRFGDVFGIGCVLFVILAFVRNAIISRNRHL
ncbi:MAG TPA: apolipoprotein N-acyltransferase, partial [bacterium]|nr:apolipoprotein N-acyltransferase [bacterium]